MSASQLYGQWVEDWTWRALLSDLCWWVFLLSHFPMGEFITDIEYLFEFWFFHVIHAFLSYTKAKSCHNFSLFRIHTTGIIVPISCPKIKVFFSISFNNPHFDNIFLYTFYLWFCIEFLINYFCHPFDLAPQDKPDENESTEARGCRIGNQFHLAGSSWYPYLLPNGFDTCNICTCNLSLRVSCTRNKCIKVRNLNDL